MASHETPPDRMGPDDCDPFWGDLHKHHTPPRDPGMEELVEAGRHHLDFVGVLCYPAVWFMKGKRDGIREETVGWRDEFAGWWNDIERTAKRYNEPGTFVTLPGYEWTGDRTRWGDHNVFYFEEGHPLELCETAEELYDHVDEHDALALPHHTGYAVANRGKDWDLFDPELSPVVEIFSGHGSSEGVDAPFSLLSNTSMAPRTSGGTYLDALDRGLRVGVIASNDGYGLPGTWGRGIAGMWAKELSRAGVREALETRRCFGVTGDRIVVWLDVNGHPMGALVEDSDSSPTATVQVEAQRRIDRIEIIHDGRPVDTYSHQDRYANTPAPPGRYTTVIEFGWGPSPEYGDFDETIVEWQGTMSIDGGQINDVQPRFRGLGSRIHQDGDEWRFNLATDRSGMGTHSDREGIVIDFEADRNAELVIEFDEQGRDQVRVPVAKLRGATHLSVFDAEAHRRVEESLAVSPDDVVNRDLFYHNSPKCKVHAIHAREECAVTARFTELPRRPTGQGRAYYYARVSQVDGQYAWSSPVWLTE